MFAVRCFAALAGVPADDVNDLALWSSSGRSPARSTCLRLLNVQDWVPVRRHATIATQISYFRDRLFMISSLTARLRPKSKLRAFLLVLIACSVCFQCTVFSGGETVVKPRTHKSWYKKSRWHKRVKVGRFQLRVFERSGVKKVKMKG